MDDSVRLTDVSKELVSESFTFAGTFDEAGYIDDLHGRRNDASFGMTNLTEFDETLVRHGDDTDVWFDSTEREVRALRLRVTKTVEKGRFADVRQSDYSAL